MELPKYLLDGSTPSLTLPPTATGVFLFLVLLETLLADEDRTKGGGEKDGSLGLLLLVKGESSKSLANKSAYLALKYKIDDKEKNNSKIKYCNTSRHFYHSALHETIIKQINNGTTNNGKTVFLKHI